MGDDLDDLFGAFDGAAAESDEPEAKKQRTEGNSVEESSQSGGQGTSEVTTSQNGSDDTGRGTADRSASDSDTKPSLYASMMSNPIASSNIDLPLSESTAKKTNDGGPEREIATGTSHDKSVRSYTAYPKNLPPGHTFATVEPPQEPAKVYPFRLDPFQQQAVGYIDKDESVLVAAHTSAGKTAVAEYAVATCLKKGQRVVYTSPIKALSNQKYRDLQEEFHDV